MAIMNNNIRIKLMQMSHKSLIQTQELIKRCSKWKIFPFTINNGAIPLTETGYKPINSKITDFGQYELILAGNTPIVVIWKNSTIIYQKNKGTTDPITHKTTGQDQFYTKQYKIGDYWNAYLIDDTSGVNFDNLKQDNLFKTISTSRQYTLVMFENQITVDDYLQFFCVFNDENENIGGNTGKNQDRQLLYLSNVTNFYSSYNGTFSMQVLTFSSVNDRIVASGQNTMDFVQYSSPGSGYAFPTIINGKVTLNNTLMRDIGVRYAHVQTYGLELLCSNYYYGRPIIQGQSPIKIGNDEIYEQQVFASRRLFIAGNNEFSTTSVKNNGGLYPGINDKITTNSHPETTFYNLMDCQPTGFTNYKDWQSFLAAKQFDLLAEKDFKGVLAFDKDKATNSNGTAIGEAKFFWDSEWNINNLTGNYNVDMNLNFKYKDPITNLVIGSPTVDYSKISQKYMSSILNFNSVLFSPLIQMPYSTVQWLPFALSDIPLIGKLLNTLTLGIPVGFIITQNSQQYKKMLYFNGFLSAFFTDNLKDIFANGLIPLNAFTTNSSYAIGKLLGANVSTRAMLMKLTDRISIYPWNATNGQKLTDKVQISTIHLSQKKKNILTNIDQVYVLAEDTEFLDIDSPFTNSEYDLGRQWNPTYNGIVDGKEYAYIIDTIITQSLHQGEERHTFYSDNPFTYQGDYTEISVAQFRYNNQASLTGNAFNWTTVYKLNHDEYSESENTTFSYPANILPPNPLNIAKPIVIIPNDLSINISSDNVHLTNVFKCPQKVTSNIDEWESLNSNFNSKQTIDIKSLLDPTLLINTFSDLKRFYTSIEIYYDYKIETKEEIKNSPNNKYHYITSENFSTPKIYSGVLKINLKDLILNVNTPLNKLYKSEWNNNSCDGGVSWVYGYNDNNILNYQLNDGYKFNLSIFLNSLRLDINYSNDKFLSFGIVDNNNLNWSFYNGASLGKIEGIFNYFTTTLTYGMRYINNIKSNITKIILNPR